MAYIGTWIACITIFNFLKTDCYFSHPHTWTTAHNLYKITNHPYAWTLLLVSMINHHKTWIRMNVKSRYPVFIYSQVLFYVKIFGLTQLGIDDPWPNLSCSALAGCHVTVTPSVTRVDCLHLWYNYAAQVVTRSTGLAFVTKMSEKSKVTLYLAIQANICERPLILERD
jgi:hypothetical protein